MEVKKIHPYSNPFLQVRLEKEVIDHLWKIIDLAKTKNINFNHKLAGNISQSLVLEDTDLFLYISTLLPLIKYYRDSNPVGDDPVAANTLLGKGSKLILNQLWVNYQYETEFNPYHDHSGVYSFAIWLKIPYSWNEQKKLPLFRDMKESDIKAGTFEFEYCDSLGGIRNYGYKLSPEYEGIMLFFPAKFRHCVYPFYSTDEPRISIAGNLSYLPG